MVMISFLDIENMNQTRHNMIFFFLFQIKFFHLTYQSNLTSTILCLSLDVLNHIYIYNMIKFVHELKYWVGGVIVKYLYQELLVSTQENP